MNTSNDINRKQNRNDQFLGEGLEVDSDVNETLTESSNWTIRFSTGTETSVIGYSKKKI